MRKLLKLNRKGSRDQIRYRLHTSVQAAAYLAGDPGDEGIGRELERIMSAGQGKSPVHSVPEPDRSDRAVGRSGRPRVALPVALDSVAPGAGTAEAPTAYAELCIQLGPAQQWGTAKVKVPPEQARHLITTLAIASSALAGLAGAVLALRVAGGLVAFGCGLAPAVLIALWRVLSGPGRDHRGLRRYR
jgi:hypothetical protein